MSPDSPARTIAVVGSWLVGAHLVLLGLLLWIVADEWATPSIDANIGYGLSLMGLTVTGVPWSLLIRVPNSMGWTATGSWLAPLTIASSVLNLGLHAWAWRWSWRRAGRRWEPDSSLRSHHSRSNS